MRFDLSAAFTLTHRSDSRPMNWTEICFFCLLRQILFTCLRVSICNGIVSDMWLRTWDEKKRVEVRISLFSVIGSIYLCCSNTLHQGFHNELHRYSVNQRNATSTLETNTSDLLVLIWWVVSQILGDTDGWCVNLVCPTRCWCRFSFQPTKSFKYWIYISVYLYIYTSIYYTFIYVSLLACCYLRPWKYTTRWQWSY